MLNVPVVLNMPYSPERDIRIGLTAVNDMAYDTCGSLAFLFCCLYFAYFGNDFKQKCLESSLCEISQGRKALCYSVWHTFFVNGLIDFSELY